MANTAIFNELTVMFTPSFSEFITLYRGVERVWISGAPFVPEEDKNKDGILFAEMEDGTIQTLGPVSAYFYAQKSGYTGTFEEWVQLILDGSIHAQEAAASAQAAAGSETNAAQSATAARTSETNAAASASSASTSATNAASNANSAASSASSASASKSAAATSETNAATSASNANSSKNAAATSATNAANSASNAATSASNAAQSETNAAQSKTAAQTAKTAAENAKTAAENAKTAAQTSQFAAETAQAGAESAEAISDERAEDSEAWAVGKRNGLDVPSTDETYQNNSKYYSEQSAISANASATSASNAASSEGHAMASETNASASATNAAASASNAASSATNAAASAVNASASAISAAEAQTAAETAQTAAEEAQRKAEEAQGKAEDAVVKSPRIKDNDNWEIWNQSTQQWQDTGHKSMAEATTAYGYQNSTSGTVVPTGTWTQNPQPEFGKFLWTRIEYTWNNGSVDYFYNVSYIGVNGTGSVNSVNGLDGDVILDGTNIYIDDNAQTKETIYQGFTRIGTPITNSEIDELFDVD